MLRHRLDLVEPLSDGAVRAIDRLDCRIERFSAGQHLLREGETPTACTLLLTGFIYRHKIVGAGGRQIVAIALPGDLIDVQQVLLKEADHNVQVLTDATVARFAASDLIAAGESCPELTRALWHYALIEASITREWIANIGRRDARTRVAHLLCELATRFENAGLGPRQAFELPMTQEQLGDALALTAVHVNRTLKALEADGLILRTKRAVTVADWGRLQSAGDFDTTYLHLRDLR